MKHALQHIHFVGIGGAGMSPIAEILHKLGYRVSGSDLHASEVTQRLAGLGIAVQIGHDAAHILGAQAVVSSSAVQADNPELQAARAQRIPVLARAVLLAELMRKKTGIAVAGTHGKTTTTSLVASVLVQAGADPSFVIGGKLQSAAAHAGLGEGEHIVVEADESDASFLLLSPIVSVVTNIDADHMETYGHDLQRLRQAFVDFIHRLPFYGRAVLCSDDAGVRAVLPLLQRPLTTYGLQEGADLRALHVQALPGARMSFVAVQAGHEALPLVLNLAGVHNVQNALAALAVARELGLPDAAVVSALQCFAGVGRRFEHRGELRTQDGGRCLLIDDYGHHPVELAAVIAAARGAFPGQRLVLAFQPHRYTRTRDCFGAFVDVLAQADLVALTEVYAAGEAAIEGADGAALVLALQRRGAAVLWQASLPALAATLLKHLQDGDLLLTLGAGSIATLPARLLNAAELPMERAA